MTDTTITLPIQATMRRQPDGSFKMIHADYITVEASTVARVLLDAFNVRDIQPIEQGRAT